MAIRLMTTKILLSINQVFMEREILSSANVCYLAHFFIRSKEVLKNLHLETFLVHFELSIKGDM